MLKRFRPRGRWQWLAALVFACFTCSLCYGALVSVGVLPDIQATEAAETQIAQDAKSTAFWFTATAVTFTPTPTHTSTYTPTDTFTPTHTFTLSNTPTDTLSPTNSYTPSDTYTPTLTFTPSDTYTPTDTFTPSDTPTVTPTPPPTFTDVPLSTVTGSRTRYIATGTINVRLGPGTNFDIVGTLDYADSIRVLGEYQQWYLIEFEDVDVDDNTAWIYAPLTTSNRPNINTGSGSSGGSSTGGSSGSGSRGSNDVYASCDMSICSQYPILRRCADASTAPWNVLTARQIACCWHSRDGDSDGVACYGD